MRIVHVVTLLSANGAFGGPLSVAREQCAELAARGHNVTLVAGWDGSAEVNIPGVDIRLFRVRKLVPGAGFSGLVTLPLLNEVRRRASKADVVHVHLARDLITLPAARLLVAGGRHAVIQTHGMVGPDSRRRARLLDAAMTRRVLTSAAAQLVLTSEEEADALAMAPMSHVVRIRNGVGIPEIRANWDGESCPEIVYCARFHPRKRPLAFVSMAAQLLEWGVHSRFSMFGPDEGELEAVKKRINELGLSDHIVVRGALRPHEVLPTLARAQVYVLPSVREPFPMSLLEAMSLGVPAVITDSTGVSSELRSTRAAAVTDGSPEEMARSVAQLVSSLAAWRRASTRARAQIRSAYSIRETVDALQDCYEGTRAPRREQTGIRNGAG